MKTVRYRDIQSQAVNLGIVVGDNVFSVTDMVPQWTDPLGMWYAFRALDLNPASVADKLQNNHPQSYAKLLASGLLLPPVHAPEVWAAGVTYERSREARNTETRISDSVYDLVYSAARPELFFKATADRVVAPEDTLRLRSDSAWMVPEPEVAVVLSQRGDIVGWTLANDLSSRDIEGENPLYLPQAKVFGKSCSIGPVMLWNTPDTTKPSEWVIELAIHRQGTVVFEDSVSFSQFKRTFEELISYLCRDNPIPDGTVLMTGTGIVPPDDFTLASGDIVSISVDEMGTLSNPIEIPSGAD